ncbi:MAG: hypothetical protein Q8P68_00535 [Candidatus Peregrinibacteria bacterium]|nr:hypothetical protein [Candidatus Peregrinibacteria bacterium]MDZ4245188.1 hypothetical protein [Candidatus Gracilibacteria bacterium]
MTQVTSKKSGITFEVSDKDKKFIENISPVINGKKFEIPLPTTTPDERQQRRLAHRNERNLYKRKCDGTGKDIISTYRAEAPFPVYSIQHWWSDKWNAKDYAQDFDFSRPFFEQFAELQKKVPRLGVLQEQNENSDYTNCATNLKDCYLLFSSDYNRSCYYGVWIQRSNDCLDNLLLDDSELAYDCIFSKKLYNCKTCMYSSLCSDSAFLLDCKNCTNCFMCFGLRNQEYCLFNKKVTKEEYEDYMKKYPLTSRTNYDYFKNHFLEFIKDAPYLYMRRNGRIENSTGDFLTDVENCEECFEATEAKDCKYVQGAFQVKDAMDCCYVNNEFGYENCECFPMPFGAKFCVNCYSGSDLMYCDSCMNNCRDCFGCVGLKQSQYCILNKQYTKEEYEELLPKIIEHMKNDGSFGEFFPGNLSPYSYQESVAMDFFPLTKERAIASGFKWEEVDDKQYVPQSIAVADDLKDIDDSICSQVLSCIETGKNFRIIPQELAFYKKVGLPIPNLCPETRHQERAKFRNSRHLYDRTCSASGVALKSTYAPDRPEKVYSEEEYLKLIG